MKLSEFISSKPENIRLGQYFYNKYCKGSFGDNLNLSDEHDDAVACSAIIKIMEEYMWDESLPC